MEERLTSPQGQPSSEKSQEDAWLSPHHLLTTSSPPPAPSFSLFLPLSPSFSLLLPPSPSFSLSPDKQNQELRNGPIAWANEE